MEKPELTYGPVLFQCHIQGSLSILKELMEGLDTGRTKHRRSPSKRGIKIMGHHKRGGISPDFPERVEFCWMERDRVAHENTEIHKIA